MSSQGTIVRKAFQGGSIRKPNAPADRESVADPRVCLSFVQIVVSLKEGLFSGANVLFQAKFRDGTSIVEVSL
jgi:hypothetical protein